MKVALKDKIKKGLTKEVLNDLVSLSKEKLNIQFENTALALINELDRISKDRRLGIISDLDYNLINNRIVKGTLDLIEEVFKKEIKKSNKKVDKIKSKQKIDKVKSKQKKKKISKDFIVLVKVQPLGPITIKFWFIIVREKKITYFLKSVKRKDFDPYDCGGLCIEEGQDIITSELIKEMVDVWGFNPHSEGEFQLITKNHKRATLKIKRPLKYLYEDMKKY